MRAQQSGLMLDNGMQVIVGGHPSEVARAFEKTRDNGELFTALDNPGSEEILYINLSSVHAIAPVNAPEEEEVPESRLQPITGPVDEGALRRGM